MPRFLVERELEQEIRTRTGRRIRNLTVEMQSDCIVLRGLADSYYLKQLAQHAVSERMPEMRLENGIVVERN